ncbi:uncharacterized protein LOC108918010 [Anoplophora glabripennis]|uniref:uncharacterized protein LOC108918010 n=1 Tax=Anoplophora glabripennis TaxID=217634 RepID=UPI0008752F85|nr:uncharacterized protein LOC108918010 [Anoplophora glabripennis]XP_018580366.1 uncharacterized protein LOC108918010 [Anoplophora glabripennis]
MHSTWRNQTDGMDDIWALSEMEGVGSREIEEPPPATILEYRAQMAANNTGSVYDNPMFGDGDVTYVMPGRGRGGFRTMMRPGASQLSDNSVTEDVQRKIRQVAGMGYSNALIEQGVRAMTIANEKNKTPTSETTSTSKTSSPYKVAHPNSPLIERSSSTCSSLSSISPHPVTNGESGPPPPLSVMRQRAAEERAKSKQKASENASSPKTKSSTIKKSEKSPSLRSPCNGKRTAWQRTSPGSDDGSWRRQDGNSADRFFKSQSNGFNLNCDDFPALK